MVKSKQFRVLHMINSQQRRGAEVFASHLASCMQRRGRFKNLVCSLYHRGDDDLPIEGVELVSLGGREGTFKRPASTFRLISGLYSCVRQFRPDIIVAHGGDTLKFSVSTNLLYRKARTIYRNIGTASAWANSTARIRVNKLCLNRVDAVVSVSKYVQEDFISLYQVPESRVTCIPNGVDVSEFKIDSQNLAHNDMRRELGLSEKDQIFISVGNLSDEKGYQNFLPLMADLHRSGVAGHLVLVGDGPLRQELGQQVESLRLTSHVHFLGRRNDVPSLLAAADLFVLPSRTEGMPAVLIEAGLAGLPSVAFNAGGIGEVVEHRATGILVPPGDFYGMGQALTGLAKDPQERATLGEAARQRCHQLFNMNQVASAYEDLFLKVLSAPRSTVNV